MLLVPHPGIEPVCPAVEGGFLTTWPPGNPRGWLFGALPVALPTSALAFWVARPEKDQCGGYQLCLDSPWPRLILGPKSEGGASLSQKLMARKPQSSLCRRIPPSSPQCLQHPQHLSGPSACRCGHPRKRRPLPGAGSPSVCHSARKCTSRGCAECFP